MTIVEWRMRWVIVIAVIVGSCGRAHAQGDSTRPSPAIGDTILSDLAAAATDALLLATAPARFDGRDWAIAGGGLALAFGLMPIDDDIRDLALETRGTDGDRLESVANVYGTWTPPLVISGTLYLGGLLIDEPRVRLAGRHVAQAVDRKSVV
jgi:hypothetical protein